MLPNCILRAILLLKDILKINSEMKNEWKTDLPVILKNGGWVWGRGKIA